MLLKSKYVTEEILGDHFVLSYNILMVFKILFTSNGDPLACIVLKMSEDVTIVWLLKCELEDYFVVDSNFQKSLFGPLIVYLKGILNKLLKPLYS